MQLLLAAVGGLGPTAASAQQSPGGVCGQEADNALRLACYDRVFGVPASRSQESPVPPAPAAQPVGTPPEKPAAAHAGAPPEQSVLRTGWELGADDKRGTFVVRTHLPNYLLPWHHVNRLAAPRSPTQAPPPAYDDYRFRHDEAKFQLSLRAKMFEDVLLPGADLWVAYTQVALWQAWDRADSRPMRSTDYEPEAIFVIPLVRSDASRLPGGWQWPMLQIGLGHQSNGEDNPLSRSWNRAWLGTAFENGPLAVQLRLEKRILESGRDDNPDLVDHIGRAQVGVSWIRGPVVAGLTWRSTLTDWGRGSVQLDWSYPVRRDRPTGLRWYVQVFSGYGETLLDYNLRQTSFGAGLTLFQF
jgi:phospholipase A1